MAERATPSTRSRRSRRRRTRTSRTRGSSTRCHPRARRRCRASGSCRRRPPSEPSRAGSAARRGAPRSRRGRVLRAPARRAAAARAVGRPLGRPQRPGGARRDPAVGRVLAVVDRASSCVFGVPLAYVLARARFPGRVARARARRAADGAAAGGRRRRAALRVPAQRRPRRRLDLRRVRLPVHVLQVGRGAGRDVRGDAVPRHHRRGRAPLDGPPLRGRGRQPRRRPLDGVPARHAADDRAGALRRAPRWRGRVRSASSAPPSPSPATSRAARRRCRSRSTSSSRRNQPIAIALSLVLLAVSIVVLVSLRDHWFGGLRDGSRRDADADVGVQLGDARPRRSRSTRPTARPSPCSGRTARARRTLLRALAGLVPLDRGSVAIDGVVVDDPATGTFVVPERRASASCSRTTCCSRT